MLGFIIGFRAIKMIKEQIRQQSQRLIFSQCSYCTSCRNFSRLTFVWNFAIIVIYQISLNNQIILHLLSYSTIRIILSTSDRNNSVLFQNSTDHALLFFIALIRIINCQKMKM